MKTKILRNILLSLGAIFALAITTHAQNLYVTVIHPPHILEYTPSGVQSTYASDLSGPRGLAFDSIGNLFAAETVLPEGNGIGKVLKYNLRNHVSIFGTVSIGGVDIFLEGLATDIAGNAYVMATTATAPDYPSYIFEFTPSGERILFGSIVGQGWGLAFDSAGNLYAANGDYHDLGELAQTIYKFAPNGTRTVFVGPSAFAPGENPVGLAFDSSGNLFVSIETFTVSGADSVVYFTPIGVKNTFATGLTNPRGLAFDSSGNLFVAEDNPAPDGDILKYPPGGGSPTVFATGLNLPQFLTFGPPR
jgi:DNA-binding beta-propeller fold protein YncE